MAAAARRAPSPVFLVAIKNPGLSGGAREGATEASEASEASPGLSLSDAGDARVTSLTGGNRSKPRKLQAAQRDWRRRGRSRGVGAGRGSCARPTRQRASPARQHNASHATRTSDTRPVPPSREMRSERSPGGNAGGNARHRGAKAAALCDVRASGSPVFQSAMTLPTRRSAAPRDRQFAASITRWRAGRKSDETGGTPGFRAERVARSLPRCFFLFSAVSGFSTTRSAGAHHPRGAARAMSGRAWLRKWEKADIVRAAILPRAQTVFRGKRSQRASTSPPANFSGHVSRETMSHNLRKMSQSLKSRLTQIQRPAQTYEGATTRAGSELERIE